MSHSWKVWFGVAAILGIVGTGQAEAQRTGAQPLSFNIGAGPIVETLKAVGAQTGLTVVIYSDLGRGVMAPEVNGSYTTDEVLQRILAPAGLQAEYIDEKTVAVVSQADAKRTSGNASTAPATAMLDDAYWSRFRLSLAQQSASAGPLTDGPTQSPPAQPQEGAQLSEVVVTAQKRTERLQDVPVPVSVINAQTLAENSQLLLRDYYTSIPGLSVQADIVNQQELSIRGITQGGSGIPTVGVTVDDVPFGGATNYTAGNWLPDFDPGDLERIEVLRGPQGTLYGANSMGGLVKFVTQDPSTQGFSGRAEAGYSSVYNGAQPGFNLRASANIPISDTLAVRVSGFARQDPGYIDNPVLGLRGVNEAESDGGRVSALWKPSDTLSLKLSALYQYYKQNGTSDVEMGSGLGPWQQDYIAGVGGASNRTVQVYSAVFKAKLGSVDMTSVTGYNINRTYTTLDFGYIFSPDVQPLFGVTGAPYVQHDSPTRVSQELRFSGSLWQRFDWLAGGYYSHERDPSRAFIDASNPTSGQIVGVYAVFGDPSPRTYDEFAGFADLTYHITDHFDVQLGGRESHTRLELAPYTESGPFFGPTPIDSPAKVSKSDVFTYLLTPQFKVSPDFMVYARFASGFRPGGPNGLLPGIPSQINPDKTENYEIGAKGDFMDHLVSFDASFYYIDWKNIQLTLIDKQSSFQYGANGGAAKSEGVELSVTVRPSRGLTIDGWVDYDDAELTQAFPLTSTSSGAAGDRMPIDPRFSGHISLRQDFPLWANASGFAGAEMSYVGYREGSFTSAGQPRAQFPSYTKADLRAGVKVNSWTVNAYVNNVTNKRGLVGGGVGYDPPNAFVYITPRLMGVNVVKNF